MPIADEPNVRMGDVTKSTFAVGSHAHAESHHHSAPSDTELLAAVRELRTDLARVRDSERTRDLDAALADADDEITRTGAAGQGMRQRLRGLLTDAESVTALLTSAGALLSLLRG